MTTRFGGSFAPPLTEQQLLDAVTTIESQADSPTKTALQLVLKCCQEWWKQPDSVGDGKPHPSGRGIIVDLDKSIADALYDYIPWREELDMCQSLFDRIDNDTQKPLRDLAFHMLWHARELESRREPITSDKL
jgi:hypothetical protein